MAKPTDILANRLSARMQQKELNPMREALLASQAQQGNVMAGQSTMQAQPAALMTAGPDAAAIPGTEGMGAAPQMQGQGQQMQLPLSPRQQMIMAAAQDPRQFAMLAGSQAGALSLGEEMKQQPRSREIVVHKGDELNERLGLGLKDAESAIVKLDYDQQDRQLPGFAITQYKTTADNTEGNGARSQYPSGPLGQLMFINDIRAAHGQPPKTPEETEKFFDESRMTSTQQQAYRRWYDQQVAAGVPEKEIMDFEDWMPSFGASLGFANAVGPEVAKRLSEYEGAAAKSVQSIKSIEQAYQLIDQGIVAGAAAEPRLALVRAIDTVLGRETDARSAATDAYLAASGTRVAEQITAFGAGTGLSDADRDFARLITAGKIDMTPQALRMALEILARGKLGEIQKYNQRLDGLQGEAAYLKSFYDKLAPPDTIYGRISPLAQAPEGSTDEQKLAFYNNQRPSYLPQGANQQLPPPGGGQGPVPQLQMPGPDATPDELVRYYQQRR